MSKCFDCGEDIQKGTDAYYDLGYCSVCFERHLDRIEGANDVKGASILIGLTLIVWGLIIGGILKAVGVL